MAPLRFVCVLFLLWVTKTVIYFRCFGKLDFKCGTPLLSIIILQENVDDVVGHIITSLYGRRFYALPVVCRIILALSLFVASSNFYLHSAL